MIFYRKWQPVAALTFDLDDTLYDNGPVIRAAEQITQQHMASHYPATRDKQYAWWLTVRQQVIQDIPEYRYDMIRLRREVLTRGLSGCGYNGQQLLTAVDDICNLFNQCRSDFTVAADVQQVLARLAEHYPLVAITNGNVNLQTIGIADYFQLALHASITQPAKPASSMFRRASEYLQLKPQQVLHVGDSLINDVLGGALYGCKTAWYAFDREMHLNAETVEVLPDVQFANLQELPQLLCP